jgi:hypothetical protein
MHTLSSHVQLPLEQSRHKKFIEDSIIGRNVCLLISLKKWVKKTPK